MYSKKQDYRLYYTLKTDIIKVLKKLFAFLKQLFIVLVFVLLNLSKNKRGENK